MDREDLITVTCIEFAVLLLVLLTMAGSGVFASDRGVYLETRSADLTVVQVYDVWLDRKLGCDRRLGEFLTQAEAKEHLVWCKANILGE